VARALEVLLCYRCLRAGRAGLHILPADLRPHRPTLGRLLRIGLPLAANRSSDSVGFAVFQTIVNTLGTTVIGAFAVGFRVIFLFMVPAHALAMAAAPIVGQALGAGKPRLARRAVGVSALLAAGMLFVPLVMLLIFGRAVGRFFIQDPEVVAEVGRFLRVVPASSYFFGVLMVLLAAFYGSGHTTPAMLVGLLRLWVLRVPLALVLVYRVGLGSMGIYVAMVVGNVVCAVIALGLFLWGRWQMAVVPTRGEAPEALEPHPEEEGAAEPAPPATRR